MRVADYVKDNNLFQSLQFKREMIHPWAIKGYQGFFA